eukprot:1330240-Ditylum_brightwellii.AAC.1
MYEEDIEDETDEVNEGIDNPLLYDPNSLVGDIEASTNVFDEYFEVELILDLGLDGRQMKGT